MLYNVLQMTRNNTNHFCQIYAHLTLKSQMCISEKYRTLINHISFDNPLLAILVMFSCSFKPWQQISYAHHHLNHPHCSWIIPKVDTKNWDTWTYNLCRKFETLRTFIEFDVTFLDKLMIASCSGNLNEHLSYEFHHLIHQGLPRNQTWTLNKNLEIFNKFY